MMCRAIAGSVHYPEEQSAPGGCRWKRQARAGRRPGHPEGWVTALDLPAASRKVEVAFHGRRRL